MPCPFSSARWYRAVPRKQIQRVPSSVREGSANTSATAAALGFGIMAAAIRAPTASLAARSGSAERCA
jgi:hypothetical protein